MIVSNQTFRLREALDEAGIIYTINDLERETSSEYYAREETRVANLKVSWAFLHQIGCDEATGITKGWPKKMEVREQGKYPKAESVEEIVGRLVG